MWSPKLQKHVWGPQTNVILFICLTDYICWKNCLRTNVCCCFNVFLTFSRHDHAEFGCRSAKCRALVPKCVIFVKKSESGTCPDLSSGCPGRQVLPGWVLFHLSPEIIFCGKIIFHWCHEFLNPIQTKWCRIRWSFCEIVGCRPRSYKNC